MRLIDILREKITCVIHTSTQEEADMLFKAIDSDNDAEWVSWWNKYKEKTCYSIKLGEAVQYGSTDSYIETGTKIIEFSDLVKTDGFYNFTTSCFDLSVFNKETPEPVVPTLKEIKEKRLSCVVHTKSELEAVMLVGYMPQKDWINSPADYWRFYAEEMCYHIENGQVVGFAPISFCKEYYPHYGEIYEFSDFLANGGVLGIRDFKVIPQNDTARDGNRNTELFKKEFNVKWIEEEKKMPTKFTFYFNVNEGTRIDKSCNGTIPTITTSVVLDKFGDPDRRKCYSLEGEATCDEADYDMRQGVLEALANAVFDGNFEKAYGKAVKTNAFCERQDRTCHYCGQLFDTIAEKEAHEVWHIERKKARRERYLLRKRAKEIAFEEQAQKMAKEMIKEDK